MIQRTITLILAAMLALSVLTACSRSSSAASSSQTSDQANALSSVAVVNTGSGVATGSTSAASSATVSASAALADRSQPRNDPAAPVEDDAAAGQIVLHGDAITAGSGVTIHGSTATITAAGSYVLSGSLDDGQIVVDAKNAQVRLILNGVEIHSAAGAAISVLKAAEAVIVLADGTENFLSDGATYVFADPADDEPNAALFSKADLTITGGGSLSVQGNYNDGIASKDGLVIAGGAITVTAVDDGIRGKDYIVLHDGAITVDAQGDGLKSDNAEDPAKGYIAIDGGVIHVTAGGDAITAKTDVLIGAGELALTSGGGSNSRIAADLSAKGVKAGANVVIDGGVFVVDSADDAIHANDSITINRGDFTLASGDDAIHADSTVTINGGDIRITQSYEGIESAVITINDGNIAIVSSDDGINVAGGKDGSGMAPGMMPGGRPGRGGPGQDAFTYSGDYYLYINGGVIVVEAAGDGIDVNGAIEMTGGLVIVNGPTANMNGALDYDATFVISGGYLAAAGSAGMAQAPGASSSQPSLALTFPSMLPAGTLIHIEDGDGAVLLTMAPLKAFQSLVFSSPALQIGAAVRVYYGGSATGTVLGGVYLDGDYTAGDEIASFTLTGIVTQVGNRTR